MLSLRNVQYALSATIVSLWVIGWGAAVLEFLSLRGS